MGLEARAAHVGRFDKPTMSDAEIRNAVKSRLAGSRASLFRVFVHLLTTPETCSRIQTTDGLLEYLHSLLRKFLGVVDVDSKRCLYLLVA